LQRATWKAWQVVVVEEKEEEATAVAAAEEEDASEAVHLSKATKSTPGTVTPVTGPGG
jgi:hypothetical protein